MEYRFLPRLVGSVFVALLVAATPIGAEESEDFERFLQDGIDRLVQDGVERFQLWNVCGPITLLIESMHYDAVKIGLTHEAITTTVRSRLRAARLYGGSEITPGPYGITPALHVHVTTVPGGVGFSVAFKFNKQVSDPISGQTNLATTWDKGAAGQSMDVGYILSWVSRLTDEFIDEYLRVNEPACSHSPIDP